MIGNSLPQWHCDVRIGPKTSLIVVDMQRLFLTDTRSPWMNKKLLSIVPNIQKLVKCVGEKNVIFTRFTPPKKWQDESDSWRTYYKINQEITGNHLDSTSLNIVDEFSSFASKSSVIDRKKSASIFLAGNFHSKIKKRNTKFLIFTGIETDYCVLSSVLDAIHLGYYVIVVTDACASSKKQGQKNARGVFDRFPEQLWITSTNELINHLKR